MRWVIKHKSGRTLFVTSDEFIANNRKKMGWIVEEVKVTSREQFEASWLRRGGEESDLVRHHENHHEVGSGNVGGQYVIDDVQGHWQTWQASRAAIEIETPDFIDSRSALNKGYTVDYSNGFGDAMDAYELAIEQAGLKVKK